MSLPSLLKHFVAAWGAGFAAGFAAVAYGPGVAGLFGRLF
jgi:hypothetical protein